MNSDEPNRCLHCKGQPRIDEVPGACEDDSLFRVVCTDPRCGNRTNDWYPRSAAIAAWNRRALPDRKAMDSAVWREIHRIDCPASTLDIRITDCILALLEDER